MKVLRKLPPYFDFLINAFVPGESRRHVHLGHWDAIPDWSPKLELPMEEFARAQTRLSEILIQMAEIEPGHAVLDVGCGFGGAFEMINEAVDNMTLVGINIDRRQLEACRTLDTPSKTQLFWVEADACSLPFAPSSFDRVLCIESMFHFSSRREFFNQTAKVLRPGGNLVASDIVLKANAPQMNPFGRPIVAALQDAYGPWPDLWGVDADYERLSDATGLCCTVLRDATLNTCPSHRFTTPSDCDATVVNQNPMTEAAMTLRWLHEQGLLRYLYLKLEKRASASFRVS